MMRSISPLIHFDLSGIDLVRIIPTESPLKSALDSIRRESKVIPSPLSLIEATNA